MTTEIIILSVIFFILLILPFSIATIYLRSSKKKTDNVLEIDGDDNAGVEGKDEKDFSEDVIFENGTVLEYDVRDKSSITLGKDCKFSCLYGTLVRVGEFNERPFPENNEPEHPAIRVRKTYVVEKGNTVNSDIRSYQGVILEEGTTVYGNVFAEDNIVIGKNVSVSGVVFTQGQIYVHSGAIVGRPGEITSLIGKEKVTIEEGASIHGYVRCERALMGKTVSAT